jgi:hypothetical protein
MMTLVRMPEFMLTDREREIRHRAYQSRIDRRLAQVEPWSPDIKWAPELSLSAESYQSQLRRLFKVEATPLCPVDRIRKEASARSSCGQWIYCESFVPRGHALGTLYGARRGSVMWDGNVVIPTLHEIRERRESHNPWMSLTPMEFMTLRGGTRLAKGHVIVAGLGLGHQLIEVSQRKQVKRLTLVERSDSLVKFILPRVEPFLGCPVEVVIGDARKLIPEMSADVALVDIFPGYGGNSFPRCPNIGRVWCWGSAG